MKLSKFSATHFRCLYDGDHIDFHPITVLIGENDSGKSATLDAMSTFFSRNQSPSDADYSYAPGPPTDNPEGIVFQESEIILEADFELDEVELQKVNELLVSPINRLRIRKVANRNSPMKVQIECPTPLEEELRIDPDTITLPQIKELANKFNIAIPGGTTKSPKLIAFLEWLKSQPMVNDWSTAPKAIIAMMPDFEPVHGGSDPEAVLFRILSITYRDELAKESNRTILTQLEENIRGPLQDRASTLKATIQKYLPSIEDVVVSPEFGFESGFRRSSLQLVGRNGHPIDLSMRGAGLQQQVTMAAYEWSSGVLEKRQQEGGRPLILAFDEPDVHLDYKAQQHLFNTMGRFAETDIQVVIATHSINFINRVPIHQINHYSLSPDQSHSIIDTLQPSNDPEEREFFLNRLGSNMGLENSTMFYERCFLTIEGKTEEGALPRLFELCVGTSTHSRGVKLVNSYNNHGAIVAAQFLHRNGRPVLFMVDEDTTLHKGTSRLLTQQSLQKAGFPIDRCHMVEPSCFEYAFSDDVWCRVLNEHQVEEYRVWSSPDVASLRTSPKEFLDSIQEILHSESKPRIGVWLAAAVLEASEIPESIRNCLMQADQLANPSPIC